MEPTDDELYAALAAAIDAAGTERKPAARDALRALRWRRETWQGFDGGNLRLAIDRFLRDTG